MLYKSIPLDIGNLRPHQKDAKEQIFQKWDEVDSVMLQMPTGTGKTYLFTSLIKDILNYYKCNHKTINILIVAHRTELIDQISESLNRYDIPHGFIQGSREQHLWQKVQVASIFSLLTSKNEINVKRKSFDYIIVDEAHHSLAETYKRLFEAFPNAKKLGVTATPWRFNHEPFPPLYQVLITTPQVSWFIKEGLLADFEYISIKPDSYLQKIIDYTSVSASGDFVNEELDQAFNNQKIRSKIFASYKKFADGKKGIIYAINKEHAANLASLYNSKNINAVAIDCDTPKEERKLLIEDFKKGKIKVLVNVEIFTEGFDCPDVSFIQLARPTRSLALYLQQVGRGLRITEGKEKTIIIDNVGLYNYFGLPDANRMWQHHFKGIEDFKEIEKSDGVKLDLDLCLGNNYDEADEEMMIIRGVNEGEAISISETNVVLTVKQPQITEFSLCNYYLVIGNQDRFKVYPFIKKKGVITDSVGNCQLVYDKNANEIIFSEDLRKNISVIKKHAKEKLFLEFLSTLVNRKLTEILDISKIQSDLDNAHKDIISFYDLLKLIERLFQKQGAFKKDTYHF